MIILSLFLCYFSKNFRQFFRQKNFWLFLSKKLVCKMINIFVKNVELLDTFYENFRQF